MKYRISEYDIVVDIKERTVDAVCTAIENSLDDADIFVSRAIFHEDGTIRAMLADAVVDVGDILTLVPEGSARERLADKLG